MIKSIDYDTNSALLNVLLDEHNAALSVFPSQKQEALSNVYSIDNEYIGGITGKIFYQRLKISMLAVKEGYRGQGIGSKLVKSAIDYAKAHNCKSVTVSTLNFQGPEFYEKLGFKQYAVLENVPAVGITTHFYILYLD
ncbi:GNAT family N-acetyltransferase [Erysipelothrix sp. HDW6B]|uniref:GNAT family N-acetyltransferase n=1 Tax=Erysipelothrix TaxID=1647 RepID=UPI00135BAEA0|nr:MULTISPECIES: GNAT family N-acetyltransferase [Erysipelothrix]QIK85320.1 GNAT family N-acetyltransferase [Erysipelothrix sp. HDW6B]